MKNRKIGYHQNGKHADNDDTDDKEVKKKL